MNHTLNRPAIMRRAWAIFSSTYNFPAIRFARIGRQCFAWALKKAWAEARNAAEIAATATDKLIARVNAIRGELDGLGYRGWGTNVTRERDRLTAALRPLSSELLRRSLVASLEQVRAAA